MELTRTEIEATDKKFEHPNELVLCPRCGKKLLFRTVNTSDIVECETKDCVKVILRGI